MRNNEFQEVKDIMSKICEPEKVYLKGRSTRGILREISKLIKNKDNRKLVIRPHQKRLLESHFSNTGLYEGEIRTISGRRVILDDV